MNKSEKEILKNEYKKAYISLKKYDDKDSIIQVNCLSQLLLSLELKDLKYIAENEAIAEMNNLNLIKREAFNQLYEDFKKYNVYVNLNLDDIECYFDELKYNMTGEEVQCNNNRINILKEVV